MRASDLDLRELLSFEPTGGIIRFADERVLIFDAVALGLLRRELIRTLGATGARALLTRFGYAHGWRTADTIREGFPWDSEHDWRRAGGWLHMLKGFVRAAPSERVPDAGPKPLAEAVWQDSYEAEQHLLHLGHAEEPVCWTLTGFASGYLSRAYGQDVYCLEERCRGKGDAVCQLVGRPLAEWGDSITSHLPFYQLDSLDAVLTRVTEELKDTERRLYARRHAMGPLARDSDRTSGLVAQSAEMRRVIDVARRVAQVDSTVLITGESGVGKERVARLLHHESARASGPFVAVNCAAVPEALLESELFGHRRGAFTGATQDRVGLFEAAGGGTLLLDEIGEIPAGMQVKLLRALQEREVRRVGENRGRPVDLRILAATNRDLAEDIQAGRFRQDLYYRLRVVEIRVPPLRERRDDILPLARAFLVTRAGGESRKALSLTPAAAQRLTRYHWPGNVRELENAVERASVFATRSRIDVDDLPTEISVARPSAFVAGDARSLADVEREYITGVLRAANGNRAQAAATLGIGTATLYRKLRAYDAAGPRIRPSSTSRANTEGR
ncbi:sigma-54-dependent Fis family transcriptional regulator [Luteitalea sp. TBR-22]|uniref:sigma-54-dependent Fis family transcriptional regulator n=1 Tax=Luteitalea sp. TBR-22 TaxID=2802971 RepID=UPI001AF1D009|nr:sigma-54-dependent Fis family transcriptional regulator [Luteitalea sp. TBR-22]BCS31874.1 sigma-54-dependent Fis family transcriptional regulator [Luteitalea sp. TBR-22]